MGPTPTAGWCIPPQPFPQLRSRGEKKDRGRYVERSYGSFSRSFALPSDADPDRLEASFKDGVLTIQIPRTQESKPRQIAIKG